jgi:hypothetical protein
MRNVMAAKAGKKRDEGVQPGAGSVLGMLFVRKDLSYPGDRGQGIF